MWRLRREAASIPETLTLLAAFAFLRGDDSGAQALAAAASLLGETALAERRSLLRTVVASGTASPEFPANVVGALSGIAEFGSEAVLARARAAMPRDLARLLDAEELAVQDVVALHRRTGAVTAGDVAAAVTEFGHPSVDLDPSLRTRIVAALPSTRTARPRLPLGRAVSLFERVQSTIRDALPAASRVEPLGSLRRFEPTVGDIDILIETPDASTAVNTVLSAVDPGTVLHKGPRVLCLLVDGFPVSLRAVLPHQAAFTRLYYSGSAAHVAVLQKRALVRGWRLSAAGFQPGPAEACDTEADIYEALGVAYLPPELRHGESPLYESSAGARPALLTQADIRGDLHVHTLWSDGRDSVEAMVRTAARLGYEYVAITDHSQRAASSRVLTLDRLERQLDEIERVRARIPGIHILRGAEVDIMPDGSLDFADEILERLDIVLASLHDAAGHTPDRLLRRYIQAMEHPKVNIITHPANRFVGRDDGYALDFDALFETAVRTGTVLEVDGGPAHLDLDGALARRAVEAGVLISVDSDCHNAERLERQMRLGVGTARRGALEPRHVINTRPLDEVMAVFAHKRSRVERLGL